MYINIKLIANNYLMFKNTKFCPKSLININPLNIRSLWGILLLSAPFIDGEKEVQSRYPINPTPQSSK